LIITDAWLARSRAIHLSGSRLVLSGMVLSLLLMVVAAVLYHWVFLKGAREGWPIVGTLVRLVVQDEFAQRDRFMRDNLDALARKIGEWPRLVEIAARSNEPHRVAFYLYELASDLHGLWNRGNDVATLRFIQDNKATSQAKIALVRAAGVVISAGLGILGATPVEEMR
jgi:hypothetical protein